MSLREDFFDRKINFDPGDPPESSYPELPEDEDEPEDPKDGSFLLVSDLLEAWAENGVNVFLNSDRDEAIELRAYDPKLAALELPIVQRHVRIWRMNQQDRAYAQSFREEKEYNPEDDWEKEDEERE